MQYSYPLKEIQAAVEKVATEFFSDGTLADKTRLALELGSLQGLDAFSTAVPWRLEVQKGKPVLGFSETLAFAARDIYAHLVALGHDFPPDTAVSLGIDEARLPAPRQTPPPLKTIKGG